MTLRIGMVGCGRAAEYLHLPALSRVDEASLVAVTDELAARREVIASAVAGCRPFDSIDGLLSEGAPQAVIVATPPETHRAVVDTVLRAGVSVLVEKPLAATISDALAMERTYRDHPVTFMVGFNRRFLRPVIELNSALRDRPDGVSIDMVMTSDVGGWSAISGVRDPLDDLGSHQFDLLSYITGRPLVSLAAERGGETEARVRVSMNGNVTASCRTAQSDVSEERIEVRRGAKRYVVCMGSSRLRPAPGPTRSALDFIDKVVRRVTSRPSPMARSFERQLRYFVGAVRDGRPASPGISEGIAALRAVEAARESAANGGREVRP